MPRGYIQRMLAEKEEILLMTRQHWFVLASAIFFEIMLIIAILAAGITATILLVNPLAAAILVLLVIPGATMTRDIMIWANRQYLVTNRRVIQISGVINKNVIDSSLEKVNDVKMTQSFLGRLFNYGDVEILTASELGVNLFKRLGDPVGFKTAMLNAKEQLERGSAEKERDLTIPELIAQLDQLRQRGILTDEEFQAKKTALLAKMQ